MIKQLEQHFGQILTTLTQRPPVTLLRNIVEHPKNDNYCLAITARSGKIIVDTSMLVVDKTKNDSTDIDGT